MSTVPEGAPIIDLTGSLAALAEWADHAAERAAVAGRTAELLEQAARRAGHDSSALYTLSQHLRELHTVLTGATGGT